MSVKLIAKIMYLSAQSFSLSSIFQMLSECRTSISSFMSIDNMRFDLVIIFMPYSIWKFSLTKTVMENNSIATFLKLGEGNTRFVDLPLVHSVLAGWITLKFICDI